MKACYPIVGPPGSGKTSALLDRFQDELDQGVPPERIGVLTFTRAARREFLDRLQTDLNVWPDQVPHVSTIHAAALRLLKPAGVILLDHDGWKEFSDQYGYDLSKLGSDDADNEGDFPIPSLRSEDDQVRYVYEWGRNRRLDPLVAIGRCPVSVPVSRYLLYVRRFEAFKAEKRVHDFVDILEAVRGAHLDLPVDVGFVDEAQDLSPLQSALVEQFFAACERVYVAGDDDQAIYEFQGGDAGWFLNLAEAHPAEVLDQSYRLSACVHEFAGRIIRRNRSRFPKAFRPGDHEGQILRMGRRGAIELVDPGADTLLLARNRVFLAPYAEALIDRGVPFRVEGHGGKNPLGDRDFVDAYSLGQQMREGLDAVPAMRLQQLLALVPRSNPHVSEDARRAVGHAAKDGFVYRDAGVREGLGLGDFLQDLRTRGVAMCMRDMPRWKARYLDGLWQGHGEIPKPKLILTSIHAAKGRQADTVIVVPDLSAATARANASRRTCDAENRVFYVAVTRAQRRLILVEPSGRRGYRFPRIEAQRVTLPLESDVGELEVPHA